MARKRNINTKTSSLLSGDKESLLQSEYARLYNHYRNIALNLYKWENLPAGSGLESRHIEKYLFEQGQAFFFQDSTLGFICLPCASLNMNVHGDPTEVSVTGINYHRLLKADDGVRILNNDSALSSHTHIKHFSEIMAETYSVQVQNLRQQRFPYMISTNKKKELSVKALFNKIFNGEDAIFYDNDLLGEDGIKVLRSDAPFILDRLQNFLENQRAELLTFLGLNSAPAKDQRMVVDEVNANNPYVAMSLELGLKSRQEAVAKINEKFNLNIKVSATIEDLIDITAPTETTEEVEQHDEI